MELSDELIEALDMVVYTWSKPETEGSERNAHEAGAHLLEVMALDYDHMGTIDDVLPDLVNEMLARSGEDDVWLGRVAGLKSVLDGMIQATAAEAARDN